MGRSPSIWWQRAIKAKSLRVIESVRSRAGQAVAEVAQGRTPVLPLDGDRAQVEEHERIVGPLGQLASRISLSRWSFRSRSAGSV